MNGTEICNYADDTTLYSCDYEVRNVITRLEQDANRLTAWSPENYMKLNEDKCHFIFFGASNERANIHVGEAQIEESGKEKLLGITLDKKLSFKTMSKRYVKKLVKSFMLLRAFQSTRSPRN